MAERSRRRKKRRKYNFSRLFLTAIIVFLIVAFGLSIKTIVSLHIEQSSLKKTNTQLKDKKTELEKEMKHVDDLNYIEEQARKQLNMVKPGEILYIEEEKDKKDKE